MTEILTRNNVLITVAVVFALIGLFFLMQTGEKIGNETEKEIPDPAFLFYRELGAEFQDCGSEDLVHGYGYNEIMRICFSEALSTCALAKLHQKITTIEGDPIFTTLVIEGEKPQGCAVHVYTDSRDRFGRAGRSDTVCYKTTFDTSSGQDSFLFDICEDGTQQYFY